VTALDTNDSAALAPVAVRTLPATQELSFDLYLWPKQGPARLLLARHHPLSTDHIEGLLARGIETLYVREHEANRYRDLLTERFVKDKTRPPAERLFMLREALKNVFLDAFRRSQVEQMVQATESYASQLASILYDSDVLVVDLMGMMAYDYSVFAHSTNVATYAVLLAQELGMGGGEGEDVVAIAQGALLHDLGKRFIRQEILEKRERLTNKEREIIKEHARAGFVRLCRREDLNWGQLMMVYQHHERCDGRGYPVGLQATEIHEWARICAVIDVYEALTRDRPYRKAASKADILAYLDQEAGRGFDERIVECWIRAITKTRR
jgi:putative nucleotidyltransferase with HDIG domain